jgi:hypothetical protein
MCSQSERDLPNEREREMTCFANADFSTPRVETLVLVFRSCARNLHRDLCVITVTQMNDSSDPDDYGEDEQGKSASLLTKRARSHKGESSKRTSRVTLSSRWINKQRLVLVCTICERGNVCDTHLASSCPFLVKPPLLSFFLAWASSRSPRARHPLTANSPVSRSSPSLNNAQRCSDAALRGWSVHICWRGNRGRVLPQVGIDFSCLPSSIATIDPVTHWLSPCFCSLVTLSLSLSLSVCVYVCMREYICVNVCVNVCVCVYVYVCVLSLLLVSTFEIVVTGLRSASFPLTGWLLALLLRQALSARQRNERDPQAACAAEHGDPASTARR